jgi:hypothetical protein
MITTDKERGPLLPLPIKYSLITARSYLTFRRKLFFPQPSTPRVTMKLRLSRMKAKHKGGGLRPTMGYVGKVRKGTVVLPPEANLPEGTTVRVEPIPTETLATRLKDVIGVVREMPSDWAENHDHYIHGASKK